MQKMGLKKRNCWLFVVRCLKWLFRGACCFKVKTDRFCFSRTATTNNTARNTSLFIDSVYNGEGRADRDGARLTSQPSLSPGDFSPKIAQ